MGEGSGLPGDLRLVGRAAAPGSRHPGPSLLLGLHEGQPAAPEFYIEPPPPLLHPFPTLPGRRRNQNIYLNPERKPSPHPVPLLFSPMCF